MTPKGGKSTDHDHNLTKSEGAQDTITCKISDHSLHGFSDKCRKPLRTDGRTCRKTVKVGRMDQRTHVQVKRGYFRLRTDGRTDGQTENIMPPAPKGGVIKTFVTISRTIAPFLLERFPWPCDGTQFVENLDNPVNKSCLTFSLTWTWLEYEISLQWRHNGRNGVSNHRCVDCLLICLLRRRSKKTPKLHTNGLCEENSPVTGEFLAHWRASNAECFPLDYVITILNILWFVLWWQEARSNKELVSMENVEMHAKRAFHFLSCWIYLGNIKMYLRFHRISIMT